MGRYSAALHAVDIPVNVLDWTDDGIVGAWRYAIACGACHRAGGLALAEPLAGAAAVSPSVKSSPRRQKTVSGVADDLVRFRFNKAEARIRELTNLWMGSTGRGGRHGNARGASIPSYADRPMMPISTRALQRWVMRRCWSSRPGRRSIPRCSTRNGVAPFRSMGSCVHRRPAKDMDGEGVKDARWRFERRQAWTARRAQGHRGTNRIVNVVV
jgi:hypothetical protein